PRAHRATVDGVRAVGALPPRNLAHYDSCATLSRPSNRVGEGRAPDRTTPFGSRASHSTWITSAILHSLPRRAVQLFERPEELGQQKRLEPIASNSDDFLPSRVQRNARGASQPDAWPLDDGARRDVAVVIWRVDGNEAHLVEPAEVAVIVLLVLRLLFLLEPFARLVEDVGLHLLHARVLLR